MTDIPVAQPQDLPQSPEGGEMDQAVHEAITQRDAALQPREPQGDQVPQEGSTFDSSADIALGRSDKVGIETPEAEQQARQQEQARRQENAG